MTAALKTASSEGIEQHVQDAAPHTGFTLRMVFANCSMETIGACQKIIETLRPFADAAKKHHSHEGTEPPHRLTDQGDQPVFLWTDTTQNYTALEKAVEKLRNIVPGIELTRT